MSGISAVRARKSRGFSCGEWRTLDLVFADVDKGRRRHDVAREVVDHVGKIATIPSLPRVGKKAEGNDSGLKGRVGRAASEQGVVRYGHCQKFFSAGCRRHLIGRERVGPA